MSTTTNWRGDDGNAPRVTARVLRWYGLRLATVFHRTEGEKQYPLEPARLAELVDWYAARSDRFLVWEVDDEFRGGWNRMGGWRLNMAAIQEALPGASREIEADQRRRAYASLGAITEATVDLALELLHGSAPLIPEVDPNNLYTLNDPKRFAYLMATNRVKAHWPRDCRACRQEFKPVTFNARTCPDCRAAARLKRVRPAQTGGQA